MKLYIWREVLRDYTAGIAFAAAESVAEARAVILAQAEEWEKRSLGGDLASKPEEYELPAGGHVWGGG